MGQPPYGDVPGVLQPPVAELQEPEQLVLGGVCGNSLAGQALDEGGQFVSVHAAINDSAGDGDSVCTVGSTISTVDNTQRGYDGDWIEISGELLEVAEKLAESMGMTVEEVVIHAMREYTDRLIAEGQIPPLPA